MALMNTYTAALKDLDFSRMYGDDVTVSMYTYERPSWTGYVYPTECYFPTWINPESAPHVRAVAQAHEAMFGPERVGAPTAMDKREGRPLIDKWTFSTNGVSIQGRFGIPCVGFGPGAESQAHAPNEITWKQDLAVCAAVYAAVPGLYDEIVRPPRAADGKLVLSGGKKTGRLAAFFRKLFGKE